MTSKAKRKRVLHTTADLARWTGLSRQAIAKATREGPLAPAKIGRNAYDIAHPNATAWLEEHDVDVDAILGRGAPSREPAAPAEIEAELGDRACDDLSAIEGMTLRQVTERYGTGAEFYIYTKARKELASARRQEKLLARLDGQLIDRALVSALFQHLEGLTTTLLRDASRTIAHRLPSPSRSAEDAQGIVRDVLSSALHAAKARTLRTLASFDPTSTPDDPPPPRAPVALVRPRAVLSRVGRALRDDSAPRIVDLIDRQSRLVPPPSLEERASSVANMLDATLVRVGREFEAMEAEAA